MYSTTTDWCTFNHLCGKGDLQPLSEIVDTFGSDIIRSLWPESRNRYLRTCTLTQCLSKQYHLRNPCMPNCWLHPCKGGDKFGQSQKNVFRPSPGSATVTCKCINGIPREDFGISLQKDMPFT